MILPVTINVQMIVSRLIRRLSSVSIISTKTAVIGVIVPVEILVPGVLGRLTARVAQLLDSHGYSVVLLDEITDADLEAGLRYVDNDICAPAIAIIGQYMRWAEQHAGVEEISVLAPILCHSCRSISLRDTLDVVFKRAGYHDVKLVELSSSELRALAEPAVEEALIAHSTTIGLCGNVPVLTIKELRRTVCTHLENSGVSVVIPPLKRILDQQDFLTPSLEYFSEVGIRTAICILPFGCMSGHVYARGQVRELRKRFPEIDLTILDYDPSASDINLINRTELVIQAAAERSV